MMATQSPGFSRPRLDALTARIQSDVDAGLIPGAVMLIARGGEVCYEEALGLQEPAAGDPAAGTPAAGTPVAGAPATGTPMSIDTIFRIYSMTKPIVSVAAMMLAEQGRLLLSDPVAKLLPEMREMQVGVEAVDAAGKPVLQRVPAQQPITVQDLLRHTSGLTYGIFGDSLVKAAYRESGLGNPKNSNQDFIRTIAQLPLACQPGTTWEYSHSTDVLGIMLERLTGMTLDVLIAEMILKPLGMHESGFWVPPQDHHRIAEPFAIDPVTGASVKLSQVHRQPSLLSGGGGMVSTARDYLRFAQMLLNGGELEGARILSRKTLRYMTSDHLAEMPRAKTGPNYLPGPGYGFGLGFAVRTEAGTAVMPGSVGDFTWSGLAGTYFWIDPEEDFLAIFLMQAPEQRTHYRQLFRNLVYAALV
jgi:CubicO group peptidase (beta-lactamase class C family)